MQLARVVGTVVSSHKSPKLTGYKFLLLDKVDAGTMKEQGDHVVAMDSVGAGVGEVVFYVTGSSSRLTDVTEGKPADATVIAIVDSIDNKGKQIYQKSLDTN